MRASSGPSSARRQCYEEPPMDTQTSLSRREILAGGGALIVAFWLQPGATGFAQGAVASKPLVLTEVDSFLAIDASGMATIYSGKVDLGTGVCTALTQIAADELDLSMR